MLARLGLSPEQAQVLDDVWQQKIADDALVRSDFRVLCRHFEEAARLRKRGAEQAAARIFAVLALPAAPAASPGPTIGMAPPPANAASRSVDATAFWSADAFGDAVNRTSTMPALVLDAVLPFVEGEPSFHPGAPLSERSTDLDGTGALIPALLDAEVLPFASRSSDLDTTGALDPSLLAAGGLPFDNSPLDGDVSLVGALLAIDFEASDGGDRARDDLGGTSASIPAFRDLAVLPFGDEATIDRGSSAADLDGTSASTPVFTDPLPFAARPFDGAIDVSDVDPFGDLAGAPPESGRDLDATTAFVAIDFDEPDADGAGGDLDTTTAFLAIDLDLADEPLAEAPPAALAPLAAPPDPWRSPAARLTLEQYASLTVELDRWPAHGAAILARYGLTDLAAERAAWECVLADPAERARFASLCAEYRGWLASPR